MGFLRTGICFGFCFIVSGLFTDLHAHDPGTGPTEDRIMVTRHFTGLWEQVDQEAQGIALQVVEQADDSRRAVAYWYTYGPDRKTAWYLAVGDLVEDRIEFELYESTDVGFMEDAQPGNDSVQAIGTLTMTFENCTAGEVTFQTGDPDIGAGAFRIERFAEIMNTHCSGGISDDMHAEGWFGEQRVELLPVAAGISGIGFARYGNFPGHAEFDVAIDGLPDGVYQLFVGAQHRGELSATQGHGELAFASPAEDGKRLLNFDPRSIGMQIEIHDASGPVLSSLDSTFESGEHDHAGDPYHDDHSYACQDSSGSGHGMGGGHMGGGMQECVEDGDYIEIDAELENSGAMPQATGYAEWSMSAHRTRFSVEIGNVPAGRYALQVGGQQVGVIDAFEMHAGVYGRISFRDPEAFAMRHLDFEPRGQWISVLQGGQVILEVEFPSE